MTVREFLNVLPPDAIAILCAMAFVTTACLSGLDWWFCVWVVYG